MANLSNTKVGIDLRSLVCDDIGSPLKRYGKSWMWLCPFHQEKHPSFSVTPIGFHCFGCGKSGDHYDWLREYRKLSWAESKNILGRNYVNHIVSEHTQQRVRETIATPPDEMWQQKVSEIIAECQLTLWSDAGAKAQKYLTNRGFSEQIVRDARLGYLPGDPTQWRQIEGIRVPCGITIPWFADGAIWALKVRRAAGKPKYQQIAGGNLGGALYGIDGAQPGQPLMIVEGEFNALSANDIAGDILTAVSVGGASGRINPRWYPIIAGCSPLLAVFDEDEAGNAGADRLDLGRARRVYVPGAKDINDLLRDNVEALRAWLEGKVNAARRPPPDFAHPNLPPIDVAPTIKNEEPLKNQNLEQIEMIKMNKHYV